MQKDCYLPDYCSSESNLLLVLVLELIAVVLALANGLPGDELILHLALVSVYVQWIGLTSAALFCALRGILVRMSTQAATAFSLLLVAAITVLIAATGFRLNQNYAFGFNENLSQAEVLIRHVVISSVLYGLALRYFYIRFTGQQTLRTQSQARLQALQARIRPHFLFNSLNTIASLTHDEPEQAEQAIENLAELFRASLQAESSITLAQEIQLTTDYIDLERLRLDERLTVNWHIEDVDTQNIALPALTLQPLVENAIYHGIEPLPQGGTVDIQISGDDPIRIEITNPLNDTKKDSRREGNRMALENIRERLNLAFQGEAKIGQAAENDLYKVSITIPKPKTKTFAKSS